MFSDLYKKLHEYMKLKENMENQQRQKNREIVKQLVLEEQSDQIEDEYLQDESFKKRERIQQFLKNTFQYYGGNPFQVNINQQAVRNLEILMVCTTQKVMLIAQEIDGALIQLLQMYSPCQLLEISEEELQSSRADLNDDYFEEFDMLSGMNIQQELSSWARNQTEIRRQKSQNQVDKGYSISSQQPKISDPDIHFIQSQPLSHQPTIHQNQLSKQELQEFRGIIDEEIQNFQIEMEQQLSIQQVQQQISQFNSQSLEDNAILQEQEAEHSESVFSQYEPENLSIADRLNTRFNNIKLQMMKKKQSQESIQSFQRLVSLGKPIIEEAVEEDLSSKQPTENDITLKHIKQKSQPHSQSVQTLVGSLFTPSVLKEIQMMNKLDLHLPQQEEYQTSPRHPSSRTQPLPSPQNLHTQSLSSQPRSLQHSQYKVALLCEIRSSLETEYSEESRAEASSLMQSPNYSQLIAKSQMMAQFVVQFYKEYIGKQSLTKVMKEKVHQIYKDVQHLTKKNNDIIIPKSKEPTHLDQGTIKAYRCVQSAVNFFSASFIQANFNDIGLGPATAKIYHILVLIYAMCDKNFPLLNKKMPPIDINLLTCVFKNPSKCSVTFKKLADTFLSQEVSPNVFSEFEKQFSELDWIIENPEEQLIRKPEVHVLVRMIYYIKYYLDCLKEGNYLKFLKDQTPLLNDQINKLYEEHVWKEQGNRYQSAKQADQLQQKQSEEIYEKYGIDFSSWELNLKIQEDELKQIAKVEKELEWKEKRMIKQLKVIEQQKENSEVLEYNQKLISNNQLIKEEQHQKRQKEKREQLQEKSELNKILRESKKQQQKIQMEHERERLEDESRFKQYLKERKTQEKHQGIIHNKQDIQLSREKKQYDKMTQKEKQEEERIWKKAQEMLKRQRDLIQQKEAILKRIQGK